MTLTPSPPAPTPVPTAFVITTGSTSTQVRSPDDCAPIGDPWLRDWCRDLAGYRPDAIPASLDQPIDRATERRIYAGLAWAVLHGDDAICQNVLVGTFLFYTEPLPSPMPSASAVPSPSPDQHCRDDLSVAHGMAVTHGNAISVVSPESSVSAIVTLPGGAPLPSLAPSA